MNIRRTILAISLLVGSTAPCQAGLITFIFSGTIEVRDWHEYAILPPEIVSGTTFTARLSYDLDTPDSAENAQIGHYAIYGAFNISIAGHQFADTGNGAAIIVDNDRLLGLDEDGTPRPPFGDAIRATIPLDAPVPLEFCQATFYWLDLTATALADDSLPREIPLDLFASVDAESPLIRIYGRRIGTVHSIPSFDIVATIESVAVVPEPVVLRQQHWWPSSSRT
jgi:hypothetical protein